jgi:hypothetical protein
MSRGLIFVAALAALAALGGCKIDTGGSSSSGSSAQVAQLQLILYAHGNSSSVARRVTEAFNPGGIQATPSAAPAAATVNAGGVALGVTFNPDPLNSTVLTVHTSSGYTFCLDSASGDVCQLPVVYFESTDCSGVPLITKGTPPSNSTTALAGSVVFTGPDGTAWAVAADTPVQNDSAQSQSMGGACSPIGLSAPIFYQAVQNDPLVTLVPGANVGASFSFGAPQ